MGNAQVYSIEANAYRRTFNQGKEGEFEADVLEGYALYKGRPIFKVWGKRIKDRQTNFGIEQKYILEFYKPGKDTPEPGAAFVRLTEKERKDGSGFFTVLNSDATVYPDPADPEKSIYPKGLRLSTPGGDVVLKLNGIIQTTVTLDQNQKEVQKVTLAVDDHYCKNTMRDHEDLPEGGSIKLKSGKLSAKVDYTWTIPDEMFTNDMLDQLEEAFNNDPKIPYATFRSFFDDHITPSETVGVRAAVGAGDFN